MITKEEKQIIRKKVSKPLVYVGIVSIIMLFGGFTSAYIVRQAEGNWLEFELPQTFYLSTVFILASSLTMFIAERAVKAGKLQKLKKFLWATLVLGLAFMLFQFISWNELVETGIYFTGPSSNASGSFLYVLTGLHLAHLAGGVIALMYTTFKAHRYKYSQEDPLGVELCGIYWHFLDILWIYLFLFLLFIR